MQILWHLPAPNTLNASRTIFNGYRNAFIKLGHTFRTLTPGDNLKEILNEYSPDIFFTNIGPLYLRYLDFDTINAARKKGMKVFVSCPFWLSPLSKFRINENISLANNTSIVNLIKKNLFGDLFYNVCEQGDPRMEGFEKSTGFPHITIPLAADDTIIFPDFSEKFQADISYIGTYLPEKKKYFEDILYPLRKTFNVKIYGQEWTLTDRFLALIQKSGQLFNVPILKSFRKPQLQLEDERKIYTSSNISINIHEKYQRKYGMDCNERTFKIPLASGFEISDDVACIKKYFKEGTEIVIGYNKDDWFDKINYYIKNPDKKKSIIEAGRKKVLQQHTYVHRVLLMLSYYAKIK